MERHVCRAETVRGLSHTTSITKRYTDRKRGEPSRIMAADNRSREDRVLEQRTDVLIVLSTYLQQTDQLGPAAHTRRPYFSPSPSTIYITVLLPGNLVYYHASQRTPRPLFPSLPSQVSPYYRTFPSLRALHQPEVGNHYSIVKPIHLSAYHQTHILSLTIIVSPPSSKLSLSQTDRPPALV
jgi:hypothetical protein